MEAKTPCTNPNFLLHWGRLEIAFRPPRAHEEGLSNINIIQTKHRKGASWIAFKGQVEREQWWRERQVQIAPHLELNIPVASCKQTRAPQSSHLQGKYLIQSFIANKLHYL